MALTCLLACLDAASAWAGASFQGLGDIPGGVHSSSPGGISGDGRTIVGVGDTDFTADFGAEAFAWTAGDGLRRLGTDGELQSYASGVSYDGRVFAGFVNSFSYSEAFIYDSTDGYRRLGHLAGGDTQSYAGGISRDGTVVVGYASGPSGFEAMIYDATNGMRGLGDLPGGTFFSYASAISADGSVVVGTGTSTLTSEAFIWDQHRGMRGLGVLEPDIYFPSSRANDISADGSTVVGSAQGGLLGFTEAFVWDEANGMRGLGQIPGAQHNSFAQGVSADGSVIVGSFLAADENFRAFIWDRVHGMRVLQDVLSLEGIDLSDWVLQSAGPISDDGRTIAGLGVGPNGVEAWVAVIPEPSTALLLGLGLVMLSSGSRRPVA